MKILAVDTSTQTMYAKIKTENYTQEIAIDNAGMQHSEQIMIKIHELCKNAGIKTKDLDLLVCTRGPGSFTGLRIAMAALKGISLGNNCPLVSVSTLSTWAETIEDFDGLVISVIDAKKQRWYLGAFECKKGTVKRIMEDKDGSESDLEKYISGYKKILLVGPDKDLFACKLEMYPVEVEISKTSQKSFACALMDAGIKNFEEKGPDDIGQGPMYIRKSDAEVALEEKRRNAD